MANPWEMDWSNAGIEQEEQVPVKPAPWEMDWSGASPTTSSAPAPASEPVVGEEGSWEFDPLAAFRNIQGEPEEKGISPEEVDAGRLYDDDVIADPALMSDLRQYMVTRKGVQYTDRPDSVVYDDWKKHMRTVESGEVTLAGEILASNRYTPEEKEVALRAYQVWDQIVPMWDQGLGETGEALVDYIGAAVLPWESPSTLLSFGFGKAATGVMAKTVGREAIEVALRQGGRAGAQRLIRNNALRNAVRGGAAAGATEASIGMFADALYQKEIRQEIGVQDEYDFGQTALVGALGFALPTAASAGMTLAKGWGTGMTPGEAARARRMAKARQAGRVGPALQDSLVQAAEALSGPQWEAARAAGRGMEDLTQSQTDILRDTFFDFDNPNSVVRILEDNGVMLDFEEGKTTATILGYIDGLPEQFRKPIEDTWERVLGVPYSEARDKLVGMMSQAGEDMAAASLARRRLEGWVRDSIEASRKPLVDDLDPRTLGYMQNLWKRLLVSHPATTSVNVQGWGVASIARMSSDIVQGLMTTVYDPTTGSRMLKHSFLDKPRLYADMWGTKEMWDDVMVNLMPKWARDQLTRETFGGVANKSPANLYNMPNNFLVRSAEKYADVAARVSFVNAQDSWTRAVSGLQELERQIYIGTGRRLEDIISSGDTHLITDDMWTRVVKTSLEDTFSMDYSKGKSFGGTLARTVQTISNAPGLGFVFPFGKFMANTVAFTWKHSPFGAWDFAKYLMKARKLERLGRTSAYVDLDAVGREIADSHYTATKALADATIGTVAFLTLGQYSYEQMQQGFDWNQLENPTGDIMDRTNLAPLSQYLLGGRIGAMLWNEEAPSKEMWKEISKLLAGGEFADLGNAEGFKTMREFATWMGSDEEGAAPARENFYNQLIKTVTEIGAGFTRPLDFPNKYFQTTNEIYGRSEGNVQIDRRMAREPGEVAFQNLARYVDQAFAPFTDEGMIGVAARSASRPEGDIKDPSTLATLTGMRFDHPMNWTDMALGMIGMPNFTIDSRTAVPEYDRFINEQIAPLLNMRMKELLATPVFKEASIERKRALVSQSISAVKDMVMTEVENHNFGVDPLMYDMRRVFSTYPKADQKEALEAFGMSGTNLRDLTLEQLYLLNEYLDFSRKQYRDFIGAFE